MQSKDCFRFHFETEIAASRLFLNRETFSFATSSNSVRICLTRLESRGIINFPVPLEGVLFAISSKHCLIKTINKGATSDVFQSAVNFPRDEYLGDKTK